MNIEHSQEIVSFFSGSFVTKVDGVCRFETIINYFAPFEIHIIDLWNQTTFTEPYLEEELNDINSKAKTKLEKLINDFCSLKFDNELETFKHNQQKVKFENELLDKLFDAWEYNTNMFSLFLKWEREWVDIESVYYKYSTISEINDRYEEFKIYYYNRKSNSVELLEKNQAIENHFFWIQMHFEEVNIEKVLVDCFGKNIANTILLKIETKEGWVKYFDRYYYKIIQEIGVENEKLEKFKRIMALNWLTYVNQHFILPPSFSNKLYYS